MTRRRRDGKDLSIKTTRDTGGEVETRTVTRARRSTLGDLKKRQENLSTECII